MLTKNKKIENQKEFSVKTSFQIDKKVRYLGNIITNIN